MSMAAPDPSGSALERAGPLTWWMGPPPAREFSSIVSLAPSLTAAVAALGALDRLIACTRYCTSPRESLTRIERIGGTKNPDVERIAELRPSLVLANKEENRKDDVTAIARHAPVFINDVRTVPDAAQLLRELGALLGQSAAGETMAAEIESEWRRVRAASPGPPGLRCLYLIWRKPYMSVGGDTFIHAMLDACGFGNVLADAARYPEINADTVARLRPRVVMLSSEPYSFGERHVARVREELQLSPECAVELVDGELCSWWGPSTARGLRYLEDLRRRLESIPAPVAGQVLSRRR
ncbi:MAG: Vitamin B12-binding protein [Myxococcota bacterium]|nr:Vitamin B12-binding protein [Myxococcota bacterium]